jgi:hypothetical protein
LEADARLGLPGTLTKDALLASLLPCSAWVGYDPWLCSQRDAHAMAAAVAPRVLVAAPENLVDLNWGVGKPAYLPLDVKFAG